MSNVWYIHQKRVPLGRRGRSARKVGAEGRRGKSARKVGAESRRGKSAGELDATRRKLGANSAQTRRKLGAQLIRPWPPSRLEVHLW